MNEDVRSKSKRVRRPSLEKTAHTRVAIVQAALDTFLECGFSEARMVDVASRAGLAKGTLYLYFPTKEALFEDVLREVMVTTLSSLHEMALQPGETVRAFLERVTSPFLRDMESSKRGAIVRLILAEGTRFPALVTLYRQLVVEPTIATIRQLATRAVERGELPGDALARFPQLLVAPFVVATLWNGVINPQEPLDGEAMFEAFLDTLFGTAPRG